MNLFKYLKSDNARELLYAGIIKVGTLYGYRKEEVYGSYNQKVWK